MNLPGAMPRILIIDDDAMVARLLKDFLLEEGFEVAHMLDGESGFRDASSNPPDLILLDVNLPDSTGFQMCGRFRSHPPTKSMPIILMTGAARWPNQQAIGRQMGATDYILKPFDVLQVGQKVCQLLGHIPPVRATAPISAPAHSEAPEVPAAIYSGASPLHIVQNSHSFEDILPPASAIRNDWRPASSSHPSGGTAVSRLHDLAPADSLEHFPKTIANDEAVDQAAFLFSCSLVSFAAKLPETRGLRHLIEQLLRTGSSVGWMVREGQLQDALRNLREVEYWLQVTKESGATTGVSLGLILQECQNLVHLLSRTRDSSNV
jgi:four helix bundle protein